MAETPNRMTIKSGISFPGSLEVVFNGNPVNGVLETTVDAAQGKVAEVTLRLMVPELEIVKAEDEKPVKLVEKTMSSKDLPKVVSSSKSK